MKKYPKEIFSSIRSYRNGQTKTFSIEALFARGKEDAPLVPPNYSRLKVSIFGQDGGVNGNIRESEIDAIYLASQACLNNYLSASKEEKTEQIPQLQFLVGKHKGMTPAQVILETNDLQALRDERDFLRQNLDKYPKNQALIDCINKTAIAYKNGLLKNGRSSISIYHSDSRSVGKPDERGMKRIYGINIIFYDGKFTISISNYKAPVSTATNGSLRVQASEAVDRKLLSFDMDWSEWMNAISKCKKTADSFDKYMFAKAWNEAEKMEIEQKNAVFGHPAYQ